MRELLIDTVAYLAPAKTLEGLSPEDSAKRVPGVNHSIVEILAHMHFWQSWFLKRCEGVAEPMVTSAANGWPAAGAGDWDPLHQAFLDVLERLAAMGEDPAQLASPVTPAMDFPPIAHFTIRDALVHVAEHNAHHLGQVILLRQLIGKWPPPQGSWTW
jgi:uncharacterized damage-inducible protein DinB